MNSTEVREAFLAYFEGKGHRRVASSPLVPFGDPTLLFVNAGMVQFKDVFLGLDPRPYTRATTSQKCLRVSGKHNDLDAVGRTARHHTFFEMLGNFSFGDYFKRDAIRYAWELVTDVYGIDPARLWVTVYEQDDEARQLWIDEAGVLPERIVRLGEKDNFWSMGDTGPCGPCSEIHLDRGEAHRCGAPVCALGVCDCDRWLEFYNLVFMQFDRDASGTLTPLPKPSVDTGMGLERITSIVQGALSNWETDLFRPLLDTVALLSGVAYEPGPGGFAHRVIADHSRAATFLVADGVVPGNEGRGYVLRRIMRRAVRYGRTIGLEAGFMERVAQVVIDLMAGQYPELRERADFIRRAISQEETKFSQTLAVGLNLLDEVLEKPETRASKTVSGEDVFRLYDTYGFPRELTEEVARERGFQLDIKGFEAAMARQREQARAAARFAASERAATDVYQAFRETPTEFLGYEHLQSSARIRALVVDGQVVERAEPDQAVEVLLDRTPFYAEAGGQVGDAGTLNAAGFVIDIADTQRVLGDLIVHYGRVVDGAAVTGATVEAAVDAERRVDIARNHTATHLLHAALRKVLGSHVQQAGSLVAPDRLRFDFSHLAALTREEIAEVERLVNEQVSRGLTVRTQVMSFDEAMKEGALAFFGDKYGDRVRVVRMGEEPLAEPGEHFMADVQVAPKPFSTELCGGTHLPGTGLVGFIRVVGESSIGAGIRRIEAVTGPAAQQLVRERLDTVETLVRQLQTPAERLEQRVSGLLEELNAERRAIAALQREQARRNTASLLERQETLGGIPFVRALLEGVDADGLKEVANDLRSRLDGGGVALATVADGKPIFVVAFTPDAVARGFHAGNVVREMAKLAGGGGGGRPEFGQAGGRLPEKASEALDALPRMLNSA
jgi:alanyl-tRNA synthetase